MTKTKHSIKLTPQQKAAFKAIQDFIISNHSQYLRFSGAAGTGKSTLLSQVLLYLKNEHSNLKVAVIDKLWLAHEFQNEYDAKALTLNTQDHHIVGYCPHYLLSNVFDVLMRSPNLVEVRVERINYSPTPLRFRLLCKMTYSTLDNMQPFSQEEYQPISKEKLTVFGC